MSRHHHQRAAMKHLYLALEAAQRVIEISLAQVPPVLRGIALANLECEMRARVAAPASVFRRDRPQVDPRRMRRHNRRVGGAAVYARSQEEKAK